ncbi:MAG TPA: YihY/virulence factor BrkB family protein [Polyangiaceae bacterium]|nr:YihY/virulence factor BrkB family protein [Polyangiaceae bacterium]
MSAVADPVHAQRKLGFPRLSRTEWKHVLKTVAREFVKDNLTLIAGNIAFSAVIAIFPVLIAIISLYGLVFDPRDVARQLHELSATLPASARTLLYEQMREIVDADSGGLSVGLLVSLATTLIAGSGGMHSLIEGINLAYNAKETRSYVRIRLLALVLTVGVVGFTIGAIATIALLPHLLEVIGLEPASRVLIGIGRWPALALALMIGLSVLYRYAPNRARPSWHWLSLGAVVATVLWLIASAGFAAYAASFGDYNKTYGALAGVVVFMLWVYFSTLAILLGAELNSELERRRGHAGARGGGERANVP